MAVAEEIDKYEDDLEKLIDTGKEKGYLTFGEVNDLLPGDITSPDELDVFAFFELKVFVGAELGAIEQIDALRADGGDQIVQIVG